MTAYYNENDPHAAQWLRNLIDAGHIAPGQVDDRSITEVKPDDLDGFDQCHFFAGIGGWSYALRLAGWPDDRPVWTGSCPCQPFSTAGSRNAFDDERHLWPIFARLIGECGASVVLGEQVASKDGRVWLAGVRADLEALGYSVGAADLCAAGVGAPHIRQRLWWVADAIGGDIQRRAICGEQSGSPRSTEGQAQKRERCGHDLGRCGSVGSRLADAGGGRRERGAEYDIGAKQGVQVQSGAESFRSGVHGLADAELQHARPGIIGQQGDQAEGGRNRLAEHGDDGGVVQPYLAGPSGHAGDGDGEAGRQAEIRSPSASGAWSNAYLVACGDGNARRVGPGVAPLAHGLPRSLGPDSARQQRMDLRTAKRNRKTRLKGYGNAIVPQVAAEFIAAFMECRP